MLHVSAACGGICTFSNTLILDFLYILRAGERVYLPSLTNNESYEKTTGCHHIRADAKRSLDVML